MARTVAVLQSNYIPWKGYFDIVHDVDLFVFYDDVQYTKNDWRNRNIVKAPQGRAWLTIPVGKREDRRICDVEITDRSWAGLHWKTLKQLYGRAPHFGRYAGFFEDIYLGRTWSSLSELNQCLIRTIAREFLGIRAEFRDSREFNPTGSKLDRLLDVIAKAGASVYVSGPSARDYIPEDRFRQAGVELVWKDYGGYPEYPQFYPPFLHQVSILDLLFHVGAEAPGYIWGWRDALALNAPNGTTQEHPAARGPAALRSDAS